MADEMTIEVPGHLDGERLDKVLAEHFSISRSRAQNLVDEGVLVDGEPGSASQRVTAGQLIRSSPPGAIPLLTAEPVVFEVLHEDELLIVVDKPAGLVVHPGAGNRKGTLAAGLLHRYPELAKVGPPDRAGLVHRLDKETSGTILVGRTPDSYRTLVRALRRRDIERVYLTLVEGSMPAPTGTVEAPIGRDPARPTRRAVLHGGKTARTHYKVVEEIIEAGVSLLEVRLETGRTHQIRVHLAAISHPVVGDRVYGSARHGVPRTFLHAASLEFDHPAKGERLTISSPLPDDLAATLSRLGMPG